MKRKIALELLVILFSVLDAGRSGAQQLEPPLPQGSTYYKGMVVSQQGVGVIGCTHSQVPAGDGQGCITPSSGTNLKILPLSGDTTGVTDTAAAQAFANLGNVTIQLQNGAYYFDNVTITKAGVSFIGGGVDSTFIYEVSTTHYVFTERYGVAWPPPPNPTDFLGGTLRGFTVLPYTGVTQTAGGFLSVESQSGLLLSNLYVENISVTGLWNGLNIRDTGGQQDVNFFNNISVWNTLHSCLDYNSPSPSGDDNFTVLQCNGSSTTGLILEQGDTTSFVNLKTNGSGVLFTGGGQFFRPRFINASIEGVSSIPSCGIDFGTGATIVGPQIVGGGIDLVPNALCNATSAKFLQYTPDLGQVGIHIINALDYPGMFFSNGTTDFAGMITDILGGTGLYLDYPGTAASAVGNLNIRNKFGGGTIVLKIDKDGLMYHNAFTVSTLPTCGVTTQDAETTVTDATAFSAGAAPTGGGLFHVPVYCQNHNGSYAWITY